MLMREFYGTGDVARKLGIPARTVRDWAQKGKIPGENKVPGPAHRLFHRGPIDLMAQGEWPPVRAWMEGLALKVRPGPLTLEPFSVDPCPGELPEIKAPELHLPGGPTLPAWRLPRIGSPIEVSQALVKALWG
jgi:hypothetical protein